MSPLGEGIIKVWKDIIVTVGQRILNVGIAAIKAICQALCSCWYTSCCTLEIRQNVKHLPRDVRAQCAAVSELQTDSACVPASHPVCLIPVYSSPVFSSGTFTSTKRDWNHLCSKVLFISMQLMDSHNIVLLGQPPPLQNTFTFLTITCEVRSAHSWSSCHSVSSQWNSFFLR